MATKDKPAKIETLVIKPPNFQRADFTIIGTVPYVQNKFSGKSRDAMKDKYVYI